MGNFLIGGNWRFSKRGCFTGLILDVCTMEHLKAVLIERCLRKHQLKGSRLLMKGRRKKTSLGPTVAGSEISEYPLTARWVKHKEHLCRTSPRSHYCEDQGGSLAMQGRDLLELQQASQMLCRKLPAVIWTPAIFF